VTPFGQAEPSYSETITLNNNSNRDYTWQIAMAENSKKYILEPFFCTGKLKAKKSSTFQIKFRIFCTARINIKLGVMLAPRQQKTFFSSKKETTTTTQDVLIIAFRAESDLSASIDYDELKLENKIASGGFGTGKVDKKM